MITEAEMPYEAMQRRVWTHKCGICKAGLTVAWGGSFGYDSHVLRCSQDASHNVITDFVQYEDEYTREIERLRRFKGMDSKALMKMDSKAMLARIGQAKFPQNLNSKELTMLAEVCTSYGLDPLMQELMIYQGNPYLTINARYRKAQETGKFDGIDTRPATQEERGERNANEGDYLYRAEVYVKGASHPFIGWGRVTKKEIEKAIAQAKGHNRQEDALPVVRDPDRQCEKRAEAMGLRKAFSMPIPFTSWEEFEEQRAEAEVVEVEGVGDVSKVTGEIKEKKDASLTPVIEVEYQEVTPELEPTASIIDATWFKESIATLQDKGLTAYKDEAMLVYMRSIFKGVKGDTCYEMATNLDIGQAKYLTDALQDALKQAGA